jgi:ABC-2 type transport system permease protein
MSVYQKIFSISIGQEFAYRLNFIMWRLRNVLQIIAVFFLWDTIFSDPSKQLLGYNRETILTYIFLVMVVKAIVFSSKSMEVSGEISRGELTNYLLRPMSYFKYWMSRDIASKALNIMFSLVEIILLFLILKPTLFFQTNILYIGGFLCALVLACCLYYLLIMLFSMGTFWIPEQSWGFIFLLIVFADLLGGTLYPIDVLPGIIQQILYLTPFPYLIFMPIQIYLGKLSFVLTLKAIFVAFIWVVVLAVIVKYIWSKGLKVYEGVGR